MPDSPSKAARCGWIDQARGLAIILLVIFHAGRHAADHVAVPQWIGTALLALAPFRMPMLMVVAGLLLERSLRGGAVPFVQRKLRQILWPFLVWTLLSLVLAGEAERLLEPKIWQGHANLWFLPFLFSYFMVALLVRRAPHLLVVLVALLISVLARDGSRHGERLFVLMAYFYTGAFFGQHLERFAAWMSWRTVALLAPFVVAAALASAATGVVRYNPLWFPVVLPALVCVFSLLRQCEAARPLRTVAFVGRHAVVYYVVNSPIYVALAPWLAARGFSALAVISISLLLVLVVTTALALARTRSRAIALLFEFPSQAARREA
jgi:uncharacterized membrane protein YcfT